VRLRPGNEDERDGLLALRRTGRNSCRPQIVHVTGVGIPGDDVWPVHQIRHPPGPGQEFLTAVAEQFTVIGCPQDHQISTHGFRIVPGHPVRRQSATAQRAHQMLVVPTDVRIVGVGT
jgi:hypothetical protein